MTDDEKDNIGNIEINLGSQAAVPKTDLPLKILVVGDFAPERPEVQDWASSSFLINVTPGSLKSAMQQLMPHLSIDVPNHLGTGSRQLSVELTFTDIGDFRPEGIVRQVKELSELLDFRDLLGKFSGQETELQELNEEAQKLNLAPIWFERLHQLLSEPHDKDEFKPEESLPEEKPVKSETTGEQKSKDEILDSLLGMVDLEPDKTSDEESGGSGFVDELIKGVIQPKKRESNMSKSALETLTIEIDETLSRQVNEILHHHKFKQLESAWRGLKFLIDRTDFRESIKIDILSHEVPQELHR